MKDQLKNKIKSLTTEMLIAVFKQLESKENKESDLVNDLVMNELETRLDPKDFEKLLNDVYDLD